jgi:hypothetical protein
VTTHWWSPRIETAAVDYAETELGRAVEVVAVLDHGTEALVLLDGLDGEPSFAMLLTEATGTWRVDQDSLEPEDFYRNAEVRS